MRHGAQQDRVAHHRHQAEPAGHHLGRVGRVVRVDPRDDAVRTTGRQDAVDRVEERRFVVVHPLLQPQRQAQIPGADVHAVEPGHAENPVQVVQSLPRLHHGERDDLAVGLLLVVRAGEDAGARRAETAIPVRVVPARADKALALVARVDHRADDPVHAGRRSPRSPAPWAGPPGSPAARVPDPRSGCRTPDAPSTPRTRCSGCAATR